MVTRKFTVPVIIAATLLATAPAFAQGYRSQEATQKYNPFSHQWETTYENSELNYNPHEGSWQYTQPNAQPEYNPFSHRWEYPH